MANIRDMIKSQILSALKHPEADEGLYLRNFAHQHEVDERPLVEASDEDILDALLELIREGKVVTDQNGGEMIFQLATTQAVAS